MQARPLWGVYSMYLHDRGAEPALESVHDGPRDAEWWARLYCMDTHKQVHDVTRAACVERHMRPDQRARVYGPKDPWRNCVYFVARQSSNPGYTVATSDYS